MERKSETRLVMILFGLLSLGSLHGGFRASDIVRGTLADVLEVQ